MTGDSPQEVEPGHKVSVDELLVFFKALSDASRIKIVGLLAQKEHSVEGLAGLLGLGASTVSHHLARLAEAGLVSARAESYYNIYKLETGALKAMSGRLLSPNALAAAAQDVDPLAYDRTIFRHYQSRDGRLKTIPAQRKKLEAVLRYLSTDFEPGRRYTEREVNAILGRYHDDTASLRRELVGFGLLSRDRDGGAYWKD